MFAKVSAVLVVLLFLAAPFLHTLVPHAHHDHARAVEEHMMVQGAAVLLEVAVLALVLFAFLKEKVLAPVSVTAQELKKGRLLSKGIEAHRRFR